MVRIESERNPLLSIQMNLFFFSSCLRNDDPNSAVHGKWVDFTTLLRMNILFFSRSMIDPFWEVVAHRKNDEVAAWLRKIKKTLVDNEVSIQGKYEWAMSYLTSYFAELETSWHQ